MQLHILAATPCACPCDRFQAFACPCDRLQAFMHALLQCQPLSGYSLDKALRACGTPSWVSTEFVISASVCFAYFVCWLC